MFTNLMYYRRVQPVKESRFCKRVFTNPTWPFEKFFSLSQYGRERVYKSFSLGSWEGKPVEIC